MSRQWDEVNKIYENNESKSIPGEGIEKYVIEDLKSDAKAIKVKVKYKTRGKQGKLGDLYIEYTREDRADESVYLRYNKDKEEIEGVYENENIVELQSQDIKRVVLIIEGEVEIEGIEILSEKTINIRQIADILKEETIAADVVHATSVFSDSIFAQVLQTAVMSMSVRDGSPGNVVNYIRVEDWTIGFYTAVLGAETEQFKMEITKKGEVEEVKYWYAIIQGEDAYKYITTIDPRTKYHDISDSEREKFRVMVYKPIRLHKKMSIEFAENEKGNYTPSIVYGVGSSEEEGAVLGKGYTYKDESGFYHIYEKEDGSGAVGIVMDKDGVHIKGWADQYCEYVTFKDNGVKFKFSGEPEHKMEYIYEGERIVGYIQNSNYITKINYEEGNV